jgi:hypothetical protein
VACRAPKKIKKIKKKKTRVRAHTRAREIFIINNQNSQSFAKLPGVWRKLAERFLEKTLQAMNTVVFRKLSEVWQAFNAFCACSTKPVYRIGLLIN